MATNNSSIKTFVIDHPRNAGKYLVHACLEGPSADVFYRGRDTLIDGTCDVLLPEYAFWYNFSMHITPIGAHANFHVSDVVLEGHPSGHPYFTVTGTADVPFFWTAFATREALTAVEPFASDVSVKGAGPYKYI